MYVCMYVCMYKFLYRKVEWNSLIHKEPLAHSSEIQNNANSNINILIFSSFRLHFSH
jgi:hypothetical protein